MKHAREREGKGFGMGKKKGSGSAVERLEAGLKAYNAEGERLMAELDAQGDPEKMREFNDQAAEFGRAIEVAEEFPDLVMLHWGDIRPSARNRRRWEANDAQDAGLVELAGSFWQTGGRNASPVLVRRIEPLRGAEYEHGGEEGKAAAWELVFGERRWRAARLLERGFEHPVFGEIRGNGMLLCEMRALTDVQAFELQVMENKRRRQLSPLEEGDTISDWMEQCGISLHEAARRMGMTTAEAARRVRCTELAWCWRDEPVVVRWTVRMVELMASLPQETQEEIHSACSRQRCWPMSLADVRRRIDDLTLVVAEFPWPLDSDFHGEPCSACIRRSDRQPELFDQADLFGEGEDGPVRDCPALCLHSACAKEKQTAWVMARWEAAREEFGTELEAIKRNWGGEPEAAAAFALSEAWNAAVDKDSVAGVRYAWNGPLPGGLETAKKGERGARPIFDAGTATVVWVKPAEDREQERTLTAKQAAEEAKQAAEEAERKRTIEARRAVVEPLRRRREEFDENMFLSWEAMAVLALAVVKSNEECDFVEAFAAAAAQLKGDGLPTAREDLKTWVSSEIETYLENMERPWVAEEEVKATAEVIGAVFEALGI